MITIKTNCLASWIEHCLNEGLEFRTFKDTRSGFGFANTSLNLLLVLNCLSTSALYTSNSIHFVLLNQEKILMTALASLEEIGHASIRSTHQIIRYYVSSFRFSKGFRLLESYERKKT